ncbi:MAG: type II toxin-antitoxin system HicA family toxin, partial [Chlamydiota bacterium]|nr:type II toxin-antitoxin system HicA family toxin [Chlamydiota bacterium]
KVFIQTMVSQVKESTLSSKEDLLINNSQANKSPSVNKISSVGESTISESQLTETSSLESRPLKNVAWQIDYSLLPEIFKKELLNESSVNLTILQFLIYKMFSLVNQIGYQGKPCHQDRLVNISKIIPTLELFENLYTGVSNGDFEPKQYSEYLKTTCNWIQNELVVIKGDVSEDKKALIDNFSAILLEMSKSVCGSGLSPDCYNLGLINVVNKHDFLPKQNTLEAFEKVISTAQNIKLYFNQYFKLFLEDNLNFMMSVENACGFDYYTEMLGSEGVINSYIKNLKNRKKGLGRVDNIDFEKILGIYDYTFDKFRTFLDFVVRMNSVPMLTKLNFSRDKDLVSKDVFDLNMFQESVSEHIEVLLGYESFNRITASMGYALSSLQNSIQITLDTCAKERGKIIDVKAVEQHIKTFRDMHQKLLQTNFSLKDSKLKLFDIEGSHSGDRFFEILDYDIEGIEKLIRSNSFYDDRGLVARLYMRTYLLRTKLIDLESKIVTNYVAEIQTSLQAYKNSNSLSSLKKSFIAKQLKNKLTAVHSFMEVYDKHCVSVIEILQNFGDSFFTKEVLEEEIEPKELNCELKCEPAEEIVTNLVGLSVNDEISDMQEIQEDVSFDEKATLKLLDEKVHEFNKFSSNDYVSVRNVKRSDVIKEIIKHGYNLVNGGKGSHVKLKDKDGNIIIVPKGKGGTLSYGIVHNTLNRLKNEEVKNEFDGSQVEAQDKERSATKKSVPGVDANRSKKKNKKKPKKNFKKKR